MKLNGIVGKGSGKLGASVWSISGGEQVVRAYNPQVTNPNTDAQVAQRAKLKLMSQLAAALAAGLAFKKNGLISARNQFVSKNIGLATYANGEASVDLNELQLTPGSAALQGLITARTDEAVITVSIPGSGAIGYDRVVYVCAEKTTADKLNIVKIQTAEAGQNNDFPATLNVTANECVVYAYGVKFGSAKAKAAYENYEAAAQDADAVLSVNMADIFANSTFSATVGATVAEH